jgi:cytochrome c2
MSSFGSSIVAGVMLILALVAMFSMLEFWGTHDKRPQRPELLLWIHRVSGWSFIALFCFMLVVMLAQLARHQGELSARLVAHAMVAVALVPVLFLKVLIVRRYGGLAQLVIPLGVAVTVLAVCLAGPTAGYYMIKRFSASQSRPLEADLSPEVQMTKLGGELLTKKCSKCHTLERIYALKLPRNSWVRTVAQMRHFDPDHISVAEANAIVQYLATTLAPASALTAAQTVALEGRVLVESRCARRCHTMEKVLALRRDRADWVKVVNEMTEQAGGTILPHDVPLIIEYLVQERGIVLGTRAAVKAGESLVYKKCAKCHNLDRVFKKRGLNQAQWQKVVEDMIGYDRHWISSMEGRAIAGFLSENLR